MRKSIIYSDDEFNNFVFNGEDQLVAYCEYGAEMAREELLGAVMEALNKAPLITYGYIDTWNGKIYAGRLIDTYEKFFETMYGRCSDVSATVYIDENDELVIESAHHDGTNKMFVRQLNAAGRKAMETVSHIEGVKKIFENKTYKMPLGKRIRKYYLG